jgi:hypothetical protein
MVSRVSRVSRVSQVAAIVFVALILLAPQFTPACHPTTTVLDSVQLLTDKSTQEPVITHAVGNVAVGEGKAVITFKTNTSKPIPPVKVELHNGDDLDIRTEVGVSSTNDPEKVAITRKTLVNGNEVSNEVSIVEVRKSRWHVYTAGLVGVFASDPGTYLVGAIVGIDYHVYGDYGLGAGVGVAGGSGGSVGVNVIPTLNVSRHWHIGESTLYTGVGLGTPINVESGAVNIMPEVMVGLSF